jgi:hypothetical protein
MLSFSEFIDNLLTEQLILESRITKIKELMKDKLDTSHDSLATHKDSDSIVDHFANNADPSSNKQHTQWIINQYRKKSIRQEDHPRINTALSNFDKHKAKLDKKDLNQYKSLSDLEDAIEPHIGTIGSKKEEKRQIKSEGADLIHSHKDMTVHHLKTKEAACHYGAGTKWCTAGNHKNKFNHYNKKGKIYVIHTHDGRKYQLQHETRQLMDEKDNEVDPKEFSKKYPEIHNVKEIADPHKSGIGFHLSDKKTQDKVLSNVNKNSPSHLRIIAAKNEEHAGKFINDSDWGVRQEVAKHIEHAGKLIHDPHFAVRYEVARHKEHAGKLVNDKDSLVRYEAEKTIENHKRMK